MHFFEGNKKCAFVGKNHKLMQGIARTFCADAMEGRNAIRIEFDLLSAVRKGWSLKELMIKRLERALQEELREMPERRTDDSAYLAALIKALEENQGQTRKVIMLFLNFQLCYHIVRQGNTPEFIFFRELENCAAYVSNISLLDLEAALEIAYKGNSVLAPCVDLISVEGDAPYRLAEIQKACAIPEES